ncbi:MAG TPA: hypothetical protein DHW14_04670 [Clostridiales bacterium]|nr:hypothetical protein [Clostridiales bacterium]
MRKRTFSRLLACLVVLSVVMAFSAVPVLAEDGVSDPGTEDATDGTDAATDDSSEDGTGDGATDATDDGAADGTTDEGSEDGTDPGAGDGSDEGTGDGADEGDEPEPVPFTASGVVVAYELPGVVSTADTADSDEEPADHEAGEGEEEPAEEAEGEPANDDGSTDGQDSDEAEPAEEDGTTGEEGDGTGESEQDEATEEPAEGGEEPVSQGPFITLVNEEGEFTFPVAETFVIEAPQTETGEYILNPGDLAEVSGVDGVVDHIVVTPAEGGTRSLNAAVPGTVVAVSPTDIVVQAYDGFTYSFVMTERTMVYAGPLSLGIEAVSVGDRVVVKGDGTGGARWVRLTGPSVKAVRDQFRERAGGFGAVSEDDDQGGRGPGKGKGRGRGRGIGKGRGPRW